ncbi:MAG: hypothetical protein A2X52_11195 [Candidatus Rokubacteria bacterium GWC2_70_16]|nr:MAG: hypothetical protein A2X52_11195 [Candidatus Rokubacteria bacterium GWC2_70_16]OGL18190.1 MAG: hypothetical protein A3K12_11260 [Candidatus Rokubacteria bacterium RIFCSPLOWO2_12_FULL_71_19]
MESTVDVFPADQLRDFEVARVQRGHEVSIDEERRHELGLRPLRLEGPEGIEDLNVPLWVSPQVVLLHERVKSLARVIWIQVDGAGRWLEMVS